ncbi:ATP-binding protein [Streptomyces sp. NPDC058657]|uniref:ATP-binding protein n=1 Tax=unclassified Streptomyces TaxID=2593676 RepID=UPI00364D86C3
MNVIATNAQFATGEAQLPPRTYHLSIPNNTTAPSLARGLVVGVLAVTGHPDLIDAARTCLSDLVTNVVQHAPATPRIRIDLTLTPDGRLVIGVQDNDPAPLPRPHVADEWAECGRGLFLVREMSEDFGVEHVRRGKGVCGKRVWCALRDHAGEWG